MRRSHFIIWNPGERGRNAPNQYSSFPMMGDSEPLEDAFLRLLARRAGHGRRQEDKDRETKLQREQPPLAVP